MQNTSSNATTCETDWVFDSNYTTDAFVRFLVICVLLVSDGAQCRPTVYEFHRHVVVFVVLGMQSWMVIGTHCVPSLLTVCRAPMTYYIALEQLGVRARPPRPRIVVRDATPRIALHTVRSSHVSQRRLLCRNVGSLSIRCTCIASQTDVLNSEPNCSTDDKCRRRCTDIQHFYKSRHKYCFSMGRHRNRNRNWMYSAPCTVEETCFQTQAFLRTTTTGIQVRL